MKRRDFLKAVAAASGGMLYRSNALQSAKTPSGAPSAIAIRGLVQENGKLWQPIQIFLPTVTGGEKVVVRIDGADRGAFPIAPETHAVRVLTSPVETERTQVVAVEVAGNTSLFSVSVKPVCKLLVYVLPHSHTDIGYTDLQSAVEEKQVNNLKEGIALARKTAHYPEGSRFVWNVEVLWAVDLYMRRADAVAKRELLEAVKKGWVALNGMYTNELTGLCRSEELLQLFRYSTQMANEFGLTIDSAMTSDVPGWTRGTVTAMSQAGIRYFSAAPNRFDRIGTLMEELQDRPFWWASPSGKEKVLLWVPWMGYSLSHTMDHPTLELVDNLQSRLERIKYPYEISYIRWSGHGDNASPDPEISDFVQSWNEKYVWPKFAIASATTAFSVFEEKYGKELPERRGDITPYWEDGAGSSALETAMNANSAERILQAQALFAMRNPRTYPVSKFEDAWRNVLLYSEHTWGAWNSVSDSENKFVKDQWEIKRSFAVNADKQSRELLSLSLAGNAVAIPSEVDVHNTSSWARNELVLVSKELSAAGDQVRDDNGRSVPSQRLSTGELAIWISEIGPFSTRRYRISKGEAYQPGETVQIERGTIRNEWLRARVDEKTGGIADLRLRGSAENFANGGSSQQINGYFYLPGDRLSDVQSSGVPGLFVEEDGPLLAVLRLECSAPGCNSLVRKIRLSAGVHYLELINIIDKKRAPLNPNPGKGGPGEEFAQRGAKESVQFAFPFHVPNGRMRVDIPFAVMRPETDQLPGSCKNWMSVGRWIDIANSDHGITWVTLDAPLIEVGEISANLLGSQTNPEVWRKQITPNQTFYSWVMNNHWGTNYRAYQEGPVTFRYGLRLHQGYDPAASARFATGITQPLLATGAGTVKALYPLLRVEPSDVLVTALKPSDDGQAWIVRLFGASGKDRDAILTWSSPGPRKVWISDTSERAKRPAEQRVTVPGWGLVTLRADRA
jgi:alpha-mannosidase